LVVRCQSTPTTACQDHNTNVLCKTGAENRAQLIAHLLGDLQHGPDEPRPRTTASAAPRVEGT
jgi:hypothetical protein